MIVDDGYIFIAGGGGMGLTRIGGFFLGDGGDLRDVLFDTTFSLYLDVEKVSSVAMTME